MKGFLLLLPLLLLIGAALADNYAQEITIDLLLQPEARWKSAIDAVLSDPKHVAAAQGIIDSVQGTFSYFGCDQTCVGRLVASFKTRFPTQFAELVGMANALELHNVTAPVEALAASQYLLEISHTSKEGAARMGLVRGGCTSIVACAPDGSVVHGRNLDFSPVDAFRLATSRASWTRGSSEPVFVSGQFLLDIGVTTGVAKGKLSVSQNWRVFARPLEEMLQCIEDPNTLAPIGIALRSLLEYGHSFDEAVTILGRGTLCTPGYLIVAGAGYGEGVVLTKDGTNSSLRPHWIGCNGGEHTPWYAVQTNNDWWLPQPPHDDRMDLAISVLEGLGPFRGATVEGQLQVLSTLGNSTVRGVLNTETVFTTVMVPSSGTMPVLVRSL